MDFCTQNFLGQGELLCCHSIALSPGHTDITRFHPWSPIVTGNHLDSAKEIPKVAETTGTVEIFNLRLGISGPTLHRASACSNLHE